jgi:hypothetical protein
MAVAVADRMEGVKAESRDWEGHALRITEALVSE